MFSIKEIKALAESLAIERMVYRDDQFFELKSLISQAQTSSLVKGSKKLAERLMLKKKTERKKIKKSLVE